MSTPQIPLVGLQTINPPDVDLPGSASVIVYAVRSVSWDRTVLANGAVIPLGVIFADAVMEERHDDDSIITENPVEIGSVSNDHAYDLPQELELTYVFSPGSKQGKTNPTYLNDTYQQFLTLKQAKVLLSVVTGKRAYENMLVKLISETTDRDTENILMLRIALRQLFLTFTQTVSLAPASQQSMPQKTMPTQNGGAVSLQPAPNFTFGTGQ